jgi:hypothetical protein
MRRSLLAMLLGGLPLRMSDGLSQPVNAPPANTMQLGVQPGTSPSVVTANRVIVFGANGGIFVYNTSGQLVASITATPVTDPIDGNTTKPILTVYDPSGTDYIQLAVGNPVELNVGTGDTAEAIPGRVNSLVVGGGPTRHITTTLAAPHITGEPAGAGADFQASSFSADLSIPPSANMVASNGTSSAGVTADTVNNVRVSLTSGLFLPPVIANTDVTTITSTFAAFTRITNSWPVPADDARTGTTYRLSAWGTGTQGSTAQTLSFELTAFGVTAAGTGFPATFAGAGLAFGWNVTGTVQVTATGAGTATIQYNYTVTIKAAGASASSVLSGFGSTSAGTTTTAENLFFSVQWGSATGAPTITCEGSVFERAGP